MTRGEVFELRLTKGAAGHEQRGQRFGVVVQSEAFGPMSTIVVAPTSTAALAASFRPKIKLRGRRTVVLCEQLRAIDSSRLGKKVGRLSGEELDAVDSSLRTILGLRG